MKLKQYLFSHTAHHTYLTVGSNVIYGLLTIWFFVLASRALGPEQFGLLSLALAINTIGFDVFNLGMSQALLRFVSVALGEHRAASAQQYAWLIFRLRLLQTAFIVLTSGLIAKILAVNFYHQSVLILPFTLAIAAIGGTLLADYFVTLLRAHDNFGQSALLTILNAVFKLVLFYLFTIILAPTLNSITLAFVISPIMVVFVAWSLAPKLPRTTSTSQISVPELFHFSKWITLWGITASLASRMDIILLAKLSSTYQTGLYSAALKIASGFTLLGSSLSTVLTPKISRIIHQPELFKHRFVQTFQLVTLLSLGMIGIAGLSPWLIPFLFGLSYQPAVAIFYPLTLASIFFILALPANVALLALGHSKSIGLLSSLQLMVVTIIGLLIIPHLGGQGAALSLIASYLVVFLISTAYAIKKVFNFS